MLCCHEDFCMLLFGSDLIPCGVGTLAVVIIVVVAVAVAVVVTDMFVSLLLERCTSFC